MKKEKPSYKFIIALTEHRVYGTTLAPYLITPNSMGTFYTIKSLVIKEELETFEYQFTPIEKHLVEIIDRYSDDNIARKFSGKYSGTEFFQNIDKDFFDEKVSPYIDAHIADAIDVILENDIPFYQKPSKYINVYDEDRIRIEPELSKAVFWFKLTKEGLSYHLRVEQPDGRQIKILRKDPTIVANMPSRLLIGNNLYRFNDFSSKKLVPFFTKEVVQIPSSVTDKYLKTFVLNTIKNQHVRADGFKIAESNPNIKAIIEIEEDLNLRPVLRLYFQYGKKKFPANTESQTEVELIQQNNTYTFLKYLRNETWEENLFEILDELGIQLNDNILVKKEDRKLNDRELGYEMLNWINEYKTQLEELGFEIEQQQTSKKYYTGTQKLSIDIKTESDWFDLYAMVEFGDFKFPFIRLKKHIAKGQREFELPNGEIVILPIEWFSQFKELLPFAEGKDENLKFSKFHFQLLQANLNAETLQQIDKLKSLDFNDYEKIAPPGNLNATLRNYQADGYSWMNYLYQNNFGGCLADDMGLGKTLQTLAMLQRLKEEKLEKEIKELPGTLIVLPTSLVHNWKNEIKKFAPDLKVYQHTGTSRKKMSNFSGVVNYYDVIITTYGTMRNDIELLKTVEFNYLILDESQYIKNPTSKTYKMVCEVKSQHKLVLTGTPIENSLSDLWSQINFLNRGLLGSFTFFKKEFIVPIEKNADEEKQKQLKNLISPFILRRTKNEVAKDLPSLTEQVRVCKMTETQSNLYEEEKSAIRNSLLQNFDKMGVEKSALLVLQGLTRLRQLANHPNMLQMQSDSGKFEEVIRVLKNLISEKHKVLIFSSFVKLLNIFKDKFEQEKWDYSLLTGQTRDREEVINQFQTDEEKQLFLISLKAGGVGLNLTAADYIFILDPWWNPAAESQAINRAHRIGQNKKVFVYRFISEKSIEEKISHHQQRKSELAELFINSNNPFEAINRDEILNLFS